MECNGITSSKNGSIFPLLFQGISDLDTSDTVRFPIDGWPTPDGSSPS